MGTGSVVAGVFLYGGEIGAIPFDLFQYGYLPLYALADPSFGEDERKVGENVAALINDLGYAWKG